MAHERLAPAHASDDAGLWDWDLRTGKLGWSSGLFRLFELNATQDKASLETWTSILHLEDRQRVQDLIESSIQDRLPLQSEYRIILPSGDVRWILAVGSTQYGSRGKPLRMSGICLDITGRKRAEEEMRRIQRRQELLSETAEKLLVSDEPMGLMEELCRKVMDFLDCQVFFNFLVDEPSGRLRLNSCAGIPQAEARRIEWLDFGAAVCGTVAMEGQRIVAENIPETPDAKTGLVRSYGILAYACHPLLASGSKVIGTLSFGTRNRRSFSEDDLSLMKAIASQVATAMDRCRMLDAERKQRTFLQRMIDLAPLEIALLRGKELRLELTNSKFTATTGLDVSKDAGRCLEELAADLALMGTPAMICEIYQSGSSLKLRHYEAPGDKWQGRWWDVDGVLSEEAGHGRGVLLVAREVTEQVSARKRIEELARDLMVSHDELERRVQERTASLQEAKALAQAERQRFQEALDQLPAYLILLSPDYRVPFANRFFEERYGKSEGRRCFEYLFGRCEPCENCETFKVLQTNKPHRWEWTAPDNRLYDIYDFPFRDTDGSRLIMEVGLDITERKRDEQILAERTAEVQRQADQLRALTVELSQAEQRERKRLSVILHDHIQQLLVAAKMQLRWIKQGGSPQRLQATVQGVESILRQALEASRSLTVELSPPVLHQAGLIGGLNWLAAQLREKNQFTVNLRSDNRAEPDTEEMRFLLFECARELLFNAVKHAGVTNADVTLLRTSDGRIRLVVRDEGAGFDPNSLQKRGKDEVSFGLFSVQQRLAHFGGEMKIETAPGKGTSVALTIEAGELQPLLADRPETLPGSEGAGKISAPEKTAVHRVLIVDDHKIMRDGLVGLMRFEPDIEVVGEAADGPQAIELADLLQPDVIIMDVSLGKMSGVEATKAILARNPLIKVIGLSMYADTDVAAAMRSAGATAFLTKGGPSEDLTMAIRACRS